LLPGLYGYTETILFSMGHMPCWLDEKRSLGSCLFSVHIEQILV
jgi:hypothetical protein